MCISRSDKMLGFQLLIFLLLATKSIIAIDDEFSPIRDVYQVEKKANQYKEKANKIAESLNIPCPVFSATLSGDLTHKKKLATRYKKAFLALKEKAEREKGSRWNTPFSASPHHAPFTSAAADNNIDTPRKNLVSMFENTESDQIKERVINTLNEWIDRALYVVPPPAATADETLSLDDAPLLQDYAENNEATPGDTRRDVPDVIDTRGGFKKQLALVIREAPLPSTNQVQSIVDAVYNWIDQIVPGDNSRDFLKYNPFKPKYTSGHASGAPEPLAPDSPVNKSKGAFKSAIRFKILEAFFGE